MRNSFFRAIFSVVAVSFFFSSFAQAFFEARMSYGLLGSKADLSSICPSCSGTLPSVVPTYGLGADAILTLPIPFVPGIGVRYENMEMSASNSIYSFKEEFTRTSLLLNWRLIDTLVYLGPIFSYGLSHSTSLKATSSSGTLVNFSSDNVSSYSAGLEGGVKLIGFLVGAEVGYQSFLWNDAKDKTGNAPQQNINMSGAYAKVVLGFSI
jgi:hypothetical protein